MGLINEVLWSARQSIRRGALRDLSATNQNALTAKNNFLPCTKGEMGTGAALLKSDHDYHPDWYCLRAWEIDPMTSWIGKTPPIMISALSSHPVHQQSGKDRESFHWEKVTTNCILNKRQKPTVKFQGVEVVAQNRSSGGHIGQHQNNQAIGWCLCYGNFFFRDNTTWIFLSRHNQKTLRDNSLNNRNLVLWGVDEWELWRY